MTERAERWNATPTRWGGAVPDQADPTGGRHVFDREAAMTPIFTTLRQGGWRRSRAPLRAVPDPVDRGNLDPPTSLLPVVPPLHAVDHPRVSGTGPIDPYVPASFAPPAPPLSPTEVTTWWSPAAAVHADPVGPAGAAQPAYDPAPFGAAPYGVSALDTGSYEGASYDAAPYDGGVYDSGAYDSGAYDAGPAHAEAYGAVYEPAGYEPAGYEPTGYESAAYQPAAYEPALYDTAFHGRPSYDPARHDAVRHDAGHHPYPLPRTGSPSYGSPSHEYLYDPLTDTGRHHRRLAPAGW